MNRVQLWSCGGGRQSAGIAALIVQGELPRPDHVCMTALEWERKATFRYVNDYIRPAMRSLGIPFTFISRKKYATKDFFGGESMETPLIPAFTNQSVDRQPGAMTREVNHRTLRSGGPHHGGLRGRWVRWAFSSFLLSSPPKISNKTLMLFPLQEKSEERDLNPRAYRAVSVQSHG